MPSSEHQGKCWAAWPCTSVSFTFLTLLTVKTDFEPVTLWIVELLLLLNGRLSFLSPRNRKERFSSSFLGLFLMATILKLSQKAKHQPNFWQKYIASRRQVRGSEVCNRYNYCEALRVFLRMAVFIMWVSATVANWDTIPSQRSTCTFNSSVLKRFGSALNLPPYKELWRKVKYTVPFGLITWSLNSCISVFCSAGR